MNKIDNNSLFYREADKAFKRKLGYTMLMNVVGLLGWFAVTGFMVFIFDDSDVTRTYLIVTLVLECLVMIPVLLSQKIKFDKFIKFLSDIPADEYIRRCETAENMYDSYFVTDGYWFVPQLFRFIKLDERTDIKASYHYRWFMLEKISMDIITSQGERIKFDIRDTKAYREDHGDTGPKFPF
ncbi:MAG: hypothetical protein II782_00990 [Oscillospiraceae bacterium]|nr:hypothetical protein [Oscillospiraceae bacterium]